MPRRAGHPCAKQGCPEVVYGRGGYCLAHAREVQHVTDAERGSAASRGYGANWRRLRRMFLRENPLCEDPYGAHAGPVVATDVDHIVPRSKGGTDAWENLQSLCASCHSRKTVEQDGGWGRG